MVAIIDYDAGNIKSVEKAILYLGEEFVMTRDEDVIMNADRVILPGVGAYGDAMKKLEEYDLVRVIKAYVKTGKPFLGICLGLQLMFDSSEETPGVKGLGLLPGTITKIPDDGEIKVPQMLIQHQNFLKVLKMVLMFILSILIILLAKIKKMLLQRHFTVLRYMQLLNMTIYLHVSFILRRVEKSVYVL